MTKENRFFVDVRVGPFTYKALLDSGAQCCLAGPRMMRELAERIKPSRALIGYADQNTQPSGGYLPVMLQIDRDAGRIDIECTEILPVEMVLGVDFGRRWRVDISMGRNQWRSGDGPWHNFAKLNDTGSSRCDIVAECAGITVAGGERELVERKIKKLIPDVPPKLGHTDKIVHRIELVEGAKPVCHRTRRMTPKMEKIAHECLQKMREEGIIEVAKSEWNSAPVLVRKSDGSYRFCVDYRDLNKVTKKDGYPCKNMDTILDRLRRARYISKIDLKSAYHQVCLDEDSKAYTAFSVQGSRQYQFLRLPFGLKCAPMTFQRLMDSLFGAEVEPYVFAYLDDIILVTETFEEHVNWLERVIRILLDAKLVVNRDKCEFCCQSVKFLGYVLDSSGLRIDSERVRPIHDYPTPRNVKQVRRLLGMVGWYSRFIKNEAEIKVPLARLLRKDAPFVWGADQERAFETLKQSLSEAPVLVRPDFEKEFAIQTDASDYAIGAVLTQEREDGEHPVYYISRVLTPAERNYTVTEKECLAVIWAIEKFRPYVEGYHFKVVTDHRALSWLRNFKDPQGRVARWALKLMEYDFEIVYRKGSLHYVPDALSRAFESDERIEVFAFKRVEDKWYIKKLSEVKKSPSKYTNWCIEDGMLYKRSYNALLDPVSNAENSWRLVVPAEQRERVLAESHCLTSSGHLGAKKTYDRLACEYWWPDRTERPYDEEGRRSTLWAVVAADMMEFPRSKNQNKYLLVFQDLFTRWIEIVPLRKANGVNVLRAFEELVLFRWEIPEFLLTDNGKEFDNAVVNTALEEYGVKHLFTPPYHPQSNVVERSNRTIKTMIACYVGDKHDEWDKYLPQFRYAINTAVQSTLKVSPAFLNMGRQPKQAKSLRREVEKWCKAELMQPSAWAERIAKLDELREIVMQHVDAAYERQAKYYNKDRKEVKFEIGDRVLRRTHNLSRAGDKYNKKLDEKFCGPYEIIGKKGENVYILNVKRSKKKPEVHVSHLRKWVPRRSLRQRPA
uniref:RNA-directed DNA polymerase n=1 Tax=Trichogramma kaykai TaxID=54128 RepID=A0ABD2WCF7_9HYME